MQNHFKRSLILQSPLRLIKDYLHLHKFGIQRKKTRKITVKALQSNADKSFMFNNTNPNEAVSMVYYPDDKNNKKINTKLMELNKKDKFKACRKFPFSKAK